jgi:hypothetical protein
MAIILPLVVTIVPLLGHHGAIRYFICTTTKLVQGHCVVTFGPLGGHYVPTIVPLSKYHLFTVHIKM